VKLPTRHRPPPEAPRRLGRQVDGLYWNETYDPDGLSAPRGAIFPECVPEWSAAKVAFSAIEDEEELAVLSPDDDWDEEDEEEMGCGM